MCPSCSCVLPINYKDTKPPNTPHCRVCDRIPRIQAPGLAIVRPSSPGTPPPPPTTMSPRLYQMTPAVDSQQPHEAIDPIWVDLDVCPTTQAQPMHTSSGALPSSS